MNLRRSKDKHGWEPAFPKGIDYGLLADLPGIKWGVYEYKLDQANENWTPSNPISDELEALLWSGKRYPPALAIARVDIAHKSGSHRPNQHEFEEAYINAIRYRLSQQQNSPYFLAKAINGDGIDLVPGEWYWLLRIKGNPTIASWVSTDYFVYENPISAFELTIGQIERIQFK